MVLLAGFMVSRMLGVAPTIADAIIDQLAKPSDKATAAGGCRCPCPPAGGRQHEACGCHANSNGLLSNLLSTWSTLALALAQHIGSVEVLVYD